MFFCNRIHEKQFLPCQSSTIMKSCEARPMGKKENQVLFSALYLKLLVPTCFAISVTLDNG